MTGSMSHSSKDPSKNVTSGHATLGALAVVFGWMDGIAAIVERYMVDVLPSSTKHLPTLSDTEQAIVKMIEDYSK